MNDRDKKQTAAQPTIWPKQRHALLWRKLLLKKDTNPNFRLGRRYTKKNPETKTRQQQQEYLAELQAHERQVALGLEGNDGDDGGDDENDGNGSDSTYVDYGDDDDDDYWIRKEMKIGSEGATSGCGDK